MINIANKLKNRPQGYKLYSPLFGEVTLNNVDETISVKTSLDYNRDFNIYGQYFTGYSDAECLLFPSKEQRDWSKFNYLEKGHRVMVSDNRRVWGVYNYYKNNEVYPVGMTPNEINIFSWKYIVPIENFDFNAEDITINCKESIV